MAAPPVSSPVTRRTLPLILVRGFGGLGVEEEKKVAYQGFNDGTVYSGKRGENYIYEGLILRFMKSGWRYNDATNVVGYYAGKIEREPAIPKELLDAGFDRSFFFGDKVVIDPAMALQLFLNRGVMDPRRTLWVFRYYDLDDREFTTYGRSLVRLIDFIAKLAEIRSEEDKTTTPARVNIIAHSMGGLLVREAVQVTYPEQGRNAADYINKIVTLGTPHQGISFQIIKDWILLKAEKELEHFNPTFQDSKFVLDHAGNPAPNYASYHWFGDFFPRERLLCVVGTNYRSYAVAPAAWLNRMFSAGGEFGPNYNRSDGLVKQTFAQIPGAPRTFVHKCHGGFDSLVTARESYEIATRFFFGNVRARLRLVRGEVTRGKDLFGKSEFFLGVGIKPRRVDFELFHQSPEAENCYGPFSGVNERGAVDFRETPDQLAFDWADANKMIWEGWLDTTAILNDVRLRTKDMVLRLDFYVGERDLFGVGFSDNVIFRKQYYLRALLPTEAGSELRMFLHTGEEFAAENYDLDAALEAAEQEQNAGRSPSVQAMRPVADQDGAWTFEILGTGFRGIFGIEIDVVPEEGPPTPLKSVAPAASDIPTPPHV